jgi:hypothetical protein
MTATEKAMKAIKKADTLIDIGFSPDPEILREMKTPVRYIKSVSNASLATNPFDVMESYQGRPLNVVQFLYHNYIENITCGLLINHDTDELFESLIQDDKKEYKKKFKKQLQQVKVIPVQNILDAYYESLKHTSRRYTKQTLPTKADISSSEYGSNNSHWFKSNRDISPEMIALFRDIPKDRLKNMARQILDEL